MMKSIRNSCKLMENDTDVSSNLRNCALNERLKVPKISKPLRYNN